ncbi:MAG: CDP-alcohol phosphatidyltransferase family protein [Chthoniobacterales bacterium]
MNDAVAADLPPSERAAAQGVESTYKGRDVEGALDLIFYRPLGFRLAQLFARASISPNQVTVIATICGVVAGHLYYYEALWLNLVGMLLHVSANLFDNVDGQLARLTRRQSEQGRVIDGIGDNIVFASIYVHLCLRIVAGGGSTSIWVIAVAAGICHSFQSSAAEFCRDAYLRFGTNRMTTLVSSRELRQRARTSRGWRKFLHLLHAGYVRQQEIELPALARLRDSVQQISTSFRNAYREAHHSLVRHARLLGTSTRMFVLFVVLFLRRPGWYFIAELTLFNAIFLWLIVRQNSLAARFDRGAT